VVRTRVGYAGGTKPSPTYYNLGDHAETIQIDYDRSQITYGELLEVFWQSHDATARPYSRQYMSAIFTHDDEQKRLAEESKDRQQAQTGSIIHTVIQPAGLFTLAETYHQKYRLQNQADLMAEYLAIYPQDEWIDSTAVARVNGYLGGNGAVGDLPGMLESLGLSPAAGERLLSLARGLQPSAPSCG
jgi:peptide-methionine (S)-S-oxide reductase